MPTCSVNVILGPAKSGKTDRALTRYRRFLQAWLEDLTGPEGVWLGPTLSAIDDVRDRLTSSPLLMPRTTTFAMLAEELIARGRRRIRAIGPLEKQRILTQQIRQLLASNQLRHFTSVALTPGFTRQVSATIADLKRRDVWAEDFRKRSRNDRDRDFWQIYSAYQQHLHKHGLYDAEGRFWAAREELQNAPPQHAGGDLKFGLVVLDGFADFTTAQHDLLRLLSAHCDELLITLPADHSELSSRALLFDKPARTLEILQQSFPHLKCETTSDTHFTSAGLEYAERTLFRDSHEQGVKKNISTTGLSILVANSVQGEIREIARRIKTLLITGAATAGEIAVVVPTVHDVAPRVSEIFADFGLPLALDCQQPLATTTFSRVTSKLLQLHVGNWNFNLLLDLISNAQGLHPLGAADDPSLRRAVEHSIRRAQLPAGRALLIEQLEYWASWETNETELSLERELVALEAAIALRVLQSWQKFLDTLPARAPLSEWVHHWEIVLRSFGLISEDSELHWQFFKNALMTIQQADARLDAADEGLDARAFLELWQNVADTVLLVNRGDSVGFIRVLSAESARTLSAKHVFLAGLSEQSFSSAEAIGKLYSEHEVTGFTSDVTSSEKIAAQQTGEAMLLFYDVLTRASETLTLSYPGLDDKGQSLSPSPFLTELERCFESTTSIPIATLSLGETVATDVAPLSLSDWRRSGMAAAMEGKREWLAGLMGEPTKRTLGRAILQSIASVASRANRETFGPFEGVLMGPTARAMMARRYNPEHLWSPSQLETYATCPYQFFSKHILRLEPLEEITLRSDHLRRGNLLHQVLAAVHDQRHGAAASLTSENLIDRFMAALQRTIEETPLRGLEEALREIERREILAWAPQYAEQELNYRGQWQNFDEPFAPAHFEVRFGPKARGEAVNDAVSTLIPFMLDLGTEQIKLTGQIDRVDMGRIHGVTVFNIIDYKSGQEVKLSDQEIKAGRQLQLPLYALAAEQLLFAEQQAIALATGYWSIKSTGFASGGRSMLEFRSSAEHGLATSERWTDLNPVMLDRVKEIVQGIRAAEFPVYNENKECTRYCDFSKICRIAQIRSLEKAWIPPTPDEQSSS